jgi:hypothetical protein
MSWLFAETIPAARRDVLERSGSFEEIAQRLCRRLRVLSFRGVKGQLGLVKGCVRPEFILETTDASAFDEFFNGRSGYRAAYYSSLERGAATNRAFLEGMLEKLVDHALANPARQNLEEARLRLSLTFQSAKVWLDEEAFSFDHQLRIDILVPEWCAAAHDALSAFEQHTLPDPPEKEKGIWGVRAPTSFRLKVKGAFVAVDGSERIPADKRRRAEEIHDYGFV